MRAGEAERPARRTARHTLEQLAPCCSPLLEHTEETMNPDTIVLIHGFWVTPRSWEDWKAHYEQQGYRVLTPGYPGFEVEVEALNADPTPIENLTVSAVVDHLTKVMGHSAGGYSPSSCWIAATAQWE
jgi:pimeloyl-ACP methyl ester carboxylesterase